MLTKEAASTYLELTTIEYDIGLIGLSEWYYRMAFLSKSGGEEYQGIDLYIPKDYFDDDLR